METIKEVLMRRDGMSEYDADDLIEEAQDALQDAVNCDDFEGAENICQEFFGLEPDYMDELLNNLL